MSYTKDNGEGKLYRQPSNWDAIAAGLEREASKALNAVSLRSVVTVRYTGRGQAVLLVDGRPSRALDTYAQFEGVDATLELLQSNGRAVTVFREGGSNAF